MQITTFNPMILSKNADAVIALFDETKDVYERIEAFKMQSSIMLEKYGNGAGQHYQYENAISTYLWLRYPDKYYIFKLSEVKVVASELESDYRFKKGAYAFFLAGALSNLYDRWVRGSVTDYISFVSRRVKSVQRIVFNLGDVFILIGGVTLFILNLFRRKR